MRGANPNAFVGSDRSPLMLAGAHKRTLGGLLKVLFEHGADPNQPFPDGSTALLTLLPHLPKMACKS